MPTDPRETARKLVKLALSKNANEARNAAVKACRLIDEHALLDLPAASSVVDQAAKAAERVRAVAADPDVLRGVSALTDLFKAAGSLRKR